MKKFLTLLFVKFLPKKLRNKYVNGDERSKLAVKNIALSMAMKAANILCSLLLVPLTINYVNSDRYGIWMTLSVVIGWITFFDLGLGNGFRNRFAEAKAKGDIVLARQYVSTTYFAIGSIIVVVLGAALFANNHINWSSFLHLSTDYQEELTKVFAIVVTFTCLNMVVNIFNTLLSADMKPGLAALVSGTAQYIILFVIFLLTKTTEGSLINLALCYSGIPVFFTLLISIIVYSFTPYKKYAPSIKLIKPGLIKSIINLGVQFMLIHLCMIAIFQIINLVITRELGPNAVTQYSIANKYFSVAYMAVAIILTPIWSAFTDAYVKRDFLWMRNTLKRLERVDLLFCLMLILMVALSGIVYKIWIGDSVDIPISLSAIMSVMVALQCFAATYMFCINGTGHIRMQLIIYIICALISWPLMSLFAKEFGLVGIVFVPTFVYLAQALFGRIQLHKILNNNVSGVWSK